MRSAAENRAKSAAIYDVIRFRRADFTQVLQRRFLQGDSLSQGMVKPKAYAISRPVSEKARRISAAPLFPFRAVTLLTSTTYYAHKTAFPFKENVN